MRILFINPSTSRYNRSVSVPLGLLSIASYLQANGHIVKIYDRTVDKQNIDTVVNSFKPELCGISLISYKSIDDLLYVADFIKSNGTDVIVGGPLASVLTEITLLNDCIDAVSLGEGEETWLDIANNYEKGDKKFSNIPGMAYKDSTGKTVYTPERPFVDLSLLPPLDWSLVDVSKYFQSSYGCKKMLYLYSAKGCPFSCTFCYNKEFHKCVYRKRPLDILLQEITFLVNNHGMDGVYFADEMWCRNKTEMRTMCDSLKNLNLDFVWGCQTRVGIFDENDFEYMYKSGCRWIFFGIESGSENILQKINKKIDFDKIIPTFTACKKANIACIGSFIVGFPEETCDDLKKTVSLLNQLDTSLININYLALIPGSDIYNSLISEKKYTEAKSLRDFYKIKPLERLEYNFSKIPNLDLKVVRSHYMWKSFTAKDIPGTEKYSFAKKVVTDALKSVKTGDFISFVVSTYLAGIEFIKTVFYSFFFPSIKKKYNIK